MVRGEKTESGTLSDRGPSSDNETDHLDDTREFYRVLAIPMGGVIQRGGRP